MGLCRATESVPDSSHRHCSRQRGNRHGARRACKGNQPGRSDGSATRVGICPEALLCLPCRRCGNLAQAGGAILRNDHQYARADYPYIEPMASRVAQFPRDHEFRDRAWANRCACSLHVDSQESRLSAPYSKAAAVRGTRPARPRAQRSWARWKVPKPGFRARVARGRNRPACAWGLLP